MKTAIIIIILFIAISAVLGYSFTRKYSKLGTEFITFLDKGNMEEAYAMFSPELQEVIPFEEFKNQFSFTSSVKKISWYSRKVENKLATISGKLVFDNDAEFYTKVVFLKRDNQWKILEIDISPNTVDIKFDSKDIKVFADLFFKNLFSENAKLAYDMTTSEIQSNVTFEDFKKAVDTAYSVSEGFVPNISWDSYGMTGSLHKLQGSFFNEREERVNIDLQIIENKNKLQVSFFNTY